MPNISQSTFSNLGGAIDDLFGAKAAKTQAKGALAEAANYRQAAKFARESEIYAKTTEQLQEFQVERSNFQQLGAQRADVGGAGFAESGTALYLAMDSARQGALAKAVTTMQGQIDIAGYEEQARSYEQMATAAEMAAAAAKKSVKSSTLSGIVKGIAAVAPLFI